MKRETYYRGIPGKKWGIWNAMKKEFQFDICEDTPMLAQARLYQKIGDDARKYRFEVKQLPERKNQGKRPMGIVGDESSPFGAKEKAALDEMMAKRRR